VKKYVIVMNGTGMLISTIWETDLCKCGIHNSSYCGFQVQNYHGKMCFFLQSKYIWGKGRGLTWHRCWGAAGGETGWKIVALILLIQVLNIYVSQRSSRNSVVALGSTRDVGTDQG